MHITNLLLFGGSFDPPHWGHIKTACSVQAMFHFQKFVFLPCNTPVLKGATQASAQQRTDMLTLALTDYPEFSIDLREIQRETPSYMVDTLKSLREELGLNCTITLLLGYDAFLQLPQWHDWQALITLANLLIVQRPGTQKTTVPTALTALLQQHQTKDKTTLLTCPHSMIYQLNAGSYSISSTMIRTQLQQHQDVSLYLPKPVYEYIKQQALYR